MREHIARWHRDLEDLRNRGPSIDGEKLLDGIQLVLDFAGFIPVLGAGPDVINTIISAGRGNWGDAAINAIAIIPFWGDAAKGGKMLAKAGQDGVSHADEISAAVNAVAKNGKRFGDEVISGADEAIEGAAKLSDEFTNLTHWTPPPQGSLMDIVWKQEFADLAKRFDGEILRGGPPIPHPETGKLIYGT